MWERRRSNRIKSHRSRAWVGPPIKQWVEVFDASSGGVRVVLPREIGLGWPLTIYHVRGEKLGPGRIGTVVHRSGRNVGIRYERDLESERRDALRRVTHGISAWLSGPVETSAVVRNLSASGAAIEPMVPIRRGVKVTCALLYGGVEVARRWAVVVRTSASVAALRFIGGERGPQLVDGVPGL